MVMSLKKKNILEFNLFIKSDHMQYLIYAHLESLILKNRWKCKQSGKIINVKNRWDVICGCPVSPIRAFDHREIEHSLYVQRLYVYSVQKRFVLL